MGPGGSSRQMGVAGVQYCTGTTGARQAQGTRLPLEPRTPLLATFVWRSHRARTTRPEEQVSCCPGKRLGTERSRGDVETAQARQGIQSNLASRVSPARIT